MVRDRAGSKPAGAPTTGGDREVVMARLAFSPTRIAVPRGARVVFLNKDVAPHTVTGDSGPLDSGILGPGRRYELVVDQPLAYHCTVHPAMRARIDLEG
jgi:plastocyanin